MAKAREDEESRKRQKKEYREEKKDREAVRYVWPMTDDTYDSLTINND